MSDEGDLEREGVKGAKENRGGGNHERGEGEGIYYSGMVQGKHGQHALDS